MKKLLIIISSLTFSLATSQSYNSEYIALNDILQLNSFENVYENSPLSISVSYDGGKKYPVESFEKTINEKNNIVITSKNSFYIFSNNGKIKYSRVGNFSILPNSFGKDSITKKENKFAKEKVIKQFYYSKDNKISKIIQSYSWRDSSIVKHDFNYSYPNDSTRIENKTVNYYTNDLKDSKNPVVFSEWTVTTKFQENGSYKSVRTSNNGKKDSWFQEKNYDKNGNLIWENEEWIDSVKYIYDENNRLIEKSVNYEEKVYKYGYDKNGNRNELLIQFNKNYYDKKDLKIKVDYTYSTNKLQWTSCIIDINFIRYKTTDLEEVKRNTKFYVTKKYCK